MPSRGTLQLAKQKPRPASSLKPRLTIKSGLWLTALLPCLWFGYREIRSFLTHPQAIIVLGGAPERENFAAEFARDYPHLPIWISGGSNLEYTQAVFSDFGIAPERLHIDRVRAIDTVSNFTTLVDELKAKGINNVYLITSDYHMRRARLIGEIVFGSRDIILKPVSVPSDRSAEPWQKAVRDGARAILWITTGHTGATLSQHFGKQ
jgi:uncharacterized SAM-binding protein YcdF (DUF218 family)